MLHRLFKLYLLIHFGIGITGLHAQNMYVKKIIGTQTTYSLSNIKKINFLSGNIIVNKMTGSPDVYPLNSLRYLNFTDLVVNIPVVEKTNGIILVYPNPTIDFINIQLPIDGYKSGEIAIFSSEGKEVLKREISLQTNIYNINLNMLPQGLYLCIIKNGTKIETTKFLKL